MGDRALIAVGAAMRNITREEDVVARLGGDEFAIAIHPATREGANRVADKLLHAIRQLNIQVDESGESLAASIGVACSLPIGFDPDALLAQSDAACYRAKRSGRNRVEYAA